jgi:hypothetical protein
MLKPCGVIAGLVPAISALPRGAKNADGRDEHAMTI